MKKVGREKFEDGQATTEYALVLLAAGIIALLVIAWATDGGGSGRIGELFDLVIGNLISRTEPLE
jgi:Flp pilus assembly pilin Flp